MSTRKVVHPERNVARINFTLGHCILGQKGSIDEVTDLQFVCCKRLIRQFWLSILQHGMEDFQRGLSKKSMFSIKVITSRISSGRGRKQERNREGEREKENNFFQKRKKKP